MDRREAQLAVRTTLAVLVRLARKTRTAADDLMVTILQANEERIVDAVVQLSAVAGGPPTDEQITAALQSVGIKV